MQEGSSRSSEAPRSAALCDPFHRAGVAVELRPDLRAPAEHARRHAAEAAAAHPTRAPRAAASRSEIERFSRSTSQARVVPASANSARSLRRRSRRARTRRPTPLRARARLRLQASRARARRVRVHAVDGVEASSERSPRRCEVPCHEPRIVAPNVRLKPAPSGTQFAVEEQQQQRAADRDREAADVEPGDGAEAELEAMNPPTTAPAIPIRTVITNPPGSLPGMIHLASTPTTSPSRSTTECPCVVPPGGAAWHRRVGRSHAESGLGRAVREQDARKICREAQAHHAREPMRSAMSPTLLCADPDRDLCQLLSRALGADGCRVVVAHDGEEALEALRTAPARSGALRRRAAGHDGLALLEAMRRSASCCGAVPVILWSVAPCTAEQIERARKLGASALLRKPVPLDALIARITKLLARERDGRAADAARSKPRVRRSVPLRGSLDGPALPRAAAPGPRPARERRAAPSRRRETQGSGVVRRTSLRSSVQPAERASRRLAAALGSHRARRARRIRAPPVAR